MFNRVASRSDFTGDPETCMGQALREPHPLVTEEILAGQAPQRAWEYAMALRALEHWLERDDIRARTPEVYDLVYADIGGASSNFWKALMTWTTKPITGIDPNHLWDSDDQAASYFRDTLHAFKTYHPEQRFDAVFCLSVIEHVPGDSLQQFEQDLCSLVKPGGLLVLTTDAGEHHPDDYHFHWMRKRIYTPAGLAALHVVFSGTYDMQPLDPPDYRWDGPTVYNYSAAILSFVKKG